MIASGRLCYERISIALRGMRCDGILTALRGMCCDGILTALRKLRYDGILMVLGRLLLVWNFYCVKRTEL